MSINIRLSVELADYRLCCIQTCYLYISDVLQNAGSVMYNIYVQISLPTAYYKSFQNTSINPLRVVESSSQWATAFLENTPCRSPQYRHKRCFTEEQQFENLKIKKACWKHQINTHLNKVSWPAQMFLILMLCSKMQSLLLGMMNLVQNCGQQIMILKIITRFAQLPQRWKTASVTKACT